MVDLNKGSIIFDSPKGESTPVAVEPVLPTVPNGEVKEKVFLNFHLIQLFLLYFASFASSPFDPITNRPPICIFSSMFSFLMFCVCVCLLLLVSSDMFSMSSCRCLHVMVFLHTICFVLALTAFIQCLQRDYMFLSMRDQSSGTQVKVDFTLYVKVMACVILMLSTLGLIFTSINVFIVRSELQKLSELSARTKQPTLCSTRKGYLELKCFH